MRRCALVLRKTAVPHVSRRMNIPKLSIDDIQGEIISHYLQKSHAADVHASLSGMRNSIH